MRRPPRPSARHSPSIEAPCPEHIWRALDDTSGVGMGRIVLRAFLGLVLAALLAGGLAWSAGLFPSPLSLVP